jgi:hypothetical protein
MAWTSADIYIAFSRISIISMVGLQDSTLVEHGACWHVALPRGPVGSTRGHFWSVCITRLVFVPICNNVVLWPAGSTRGHFWSFCSTRLKFVPICNNVVLWPAGSTRGHFWSVCITRLVFVLFCNNVVWWACWIHWRMFNTTPVILPFCFPVVYFWSFYRSGFLGHVRKVVVNYSKEYYEVFLSSVA